MSEHEGISDSPVGWVAKHINRYVESDGKDGHQYMGVPSLLLTTRGRKSGKLYRTALYYGRDGDRYLLVPSNGGSDEHPSWYLNLIANPEVEVQVGAEKFSARARVATPEEKPALWQIMTSIFARYNTYQEKAGREIPVVILERL
jgi:deazaflavin-dependent oxidoreductase (nitroreductase family)